MSYSGQSVPSGSYEPRPLVCVPPAEPEDYNRGSITYGGQSRRFPSTGSRAVRCVGVQANFPAPTLSVPQIPLDSCPAPPFGVTSSSYTYPNLSPSPRMSIQTSSPASLEEGPNILGPGFVAFETSPSNASFSDGDDENMGTLMAGNFDDLGGPSNSLEDCDELDFMEGFRSTGPSSPAEHLSRAPSPQYESNEGQFGWSDISQSHVCLPTNNYDTLNTSLRPPRVDGNSKRLLASPAMQEKRTSSRTREQIDKAKAVRDVRACVRCQILHIDCGVNDECDSCRVVSHNGTVYKMPCLRARLTDTRLFRSGSARKPKLRVLLYHTGHVEPFGAPQDRPRVEVVCQGFNPMEAPPQIILSKSWISHGKKIDLHLPAYAIPPGQLNKTADKLDLFLENNWQRLASELIQSQRDDILSSTLVEAVRNIGKCRMLKGALDIAILSQLISKSFNLTGRETFGLSPVNDPESPYDGLIPLPPFLDAQLDDLVMRKLLKIQKKTLVELKDTMLGSNKRKNWLMIFLTTLVLLNNLEFIYEKQCRQMKRYLSVQRISVMDDWIRSARILNTYFHEICHGEIPFYMDWTYEAQKLGGIDRQALEYLNALKYSLELRAAELRSRARGAPGEPLVWISALFMPPIEDLR